MEANKLTLTTDYAFKKVFGSSGNERILKSFLEAILNKTITDVRVLNPEIPKEVRNGKECILDVKAKIDGKEIVNIEMHFIELPKFKKKYPKIESRLEEWLTLFVSQGKDNMTRDVEERVEEIREAEKELQRLMMDRVAFEEYEARQKWLHDQASALEYATKTGIEKGKVEGRAEGKKTKSIEIAKELIKEGMTVEFISKVTKLSLEEINKLVEN